MSRTGEKIEGLANEALGNVKQAAGKATGNDRLVAEGEAQKTVGDVEDGARNLADKITGKH
ncbi:CsbD family protein [Methylobacterium sp. NMS12]|uniref:CsbD family protein n=1 Tax=Methylobacterium sp. NMS12 TaxID=3079766 RepID=UPI003F882047